MRPRAALGSTFLTLGVLACGSEPGPPEEAVLMTFDLPANRVSGHLAASVGDVDGDGKADIGVAGVEETEHLPNEYVAWVYSGADGTLLLRLATGVAAGKGRSAIAGAGDVDGDGHADVILGNRHAALAGERSGGAWVFSGRDGELLHSFQGDRAHDAFGASVATAGDVDGDGLDDVVVGAEQHAAEAEGGGEGSGYVR
ncbi:MAG: VCBS repeat-containing protein, partial [Planctomycetota bacterium]|nr:VCBS repeat-containing protein [Planctomycetota bacterium]